MGISGPTGNVFTQIQQLGAAALEKVHTGLANKLPFTAKNQASNAPSPLSVSTAQVGTHESPGKASNAEETKKSARAFSPTHVGNLPEAERKEVKANVECYHDVYEMASHALGANTSPQSRDWKVLSDGQNPKFFELPADIQEARKSIVDTLKNEGFKPTADGKGYFNEETGTRMSVLYNVEKKELTVFIQGLATPKTQGFGARVRQIASEMFGGVPTAAEKCIKLGETLQGLKGTNISVVGHSHGGGLAQIVGLKSGAPTYCFNNRYPSKAIRNMIGNENAGNITNYHKQGDWLTGNRVINRLAAACGVTTHLGTTYIIPSERKGAFDIHNETKWVEPRQSQKTETLPRYMQPKLDLEDM